MSDKDHLTHSFLSETEQDTQERIDVENTENEADVMVSSDNSAEKRADSNCSNCVENGKKNGEKAKKKHKLNSVAKCTLVLVAIAVVAGLLLGIVNWVTYVDPDGEISEKCASYYGVENVEKVDEYVVVYDKNNYVKSCFVAYDDNNNAIGYCYYSVGGGAKDGSIELLVFIGADGVIDEISVYDQGETAGYFDKVEKANKSKYVGLDVRKIKKLQLLTSSQTATEEGEINAVSQATYTSTGYHNAIASAVYAYHEIFGGANED